MTNLPAPIPAATVVVLRDGRDGIETLMLRRSGHGAFAGHWVFPGGKVDDTDRHVAGDEVDWARRAAVREASEEAGLLLALDDLVVFSHWLPPPIQPKRFSTWFFAAAIPAGADPAVTVDGHEIDDHAWTTGAAAIAQRDRGEVELAPPTWVTLHQIRSQPDVAAFLRWAGGAPARRFSTRPTEVAGVRTLLWQGDAGYDSGDPMVPGGRNRLHMADGRWTYEHRP